MNKPQTIHRRMKSILKYAMILGLLSGCANDFDPGSRVTTLRVLAVQVDQPFAAPGETVHLNALSYDPEGRAITWGWAACINPPASTVEACLATIAADAASSGQHANVAMGTDMTTFDFTIPSDALSSLPTAAYPAAEVGIVSVACPGIIDFASGNVSIPFACRDANGRELTLDEFVLGIKHVRVRAVDRNANPLIANITFDGTEWPATEIRTVGHCDSDGNAFDQCNADKHDIAAFVTPQSFESGQDEFGVNFQEVLITEYYATEGIFKDQVRISQDPTTRWVARKAAAARDLTLWFVVHDNRGGVTWDTRQVHVD